MFIDETVIDVRAGDGGNGCYAHERQRSRPKGRPSGGDGGRGGHIYVQGCAQLHTLQDVAYRHSYKAERGVHGKGSCKDGRNGADLIIRVPLGTLVHDEPTGELLHDCLADGEAVVVAEGGRGGRGNASLASARNPNPQTVQPGRPGEQKRLRLVLKVLADVGLVGRPNAGKSTFLSKVSRAHPKIADYPFTTTQPYLGIVKPEWGCDSFVVADIPGLVEGSHEGKGLGIRFLRHIERTRVLAIMVDALSKAPKADAEVLMTELKQYSALLADKPRCFILTKSDLLDRQASKVPKGWLAMSSVSGQGLDVVIRKFGELLRESKD